MGTRSGKSAVFGLRSGSINGVLGRVRAYLKKDSLGVPRNLSKFRSSNLSKQLTFLYGITKYSELN